MKAPKFHAAMKRHPYLEGMLWLGPDQKARPRDIHFIARRPLQFLPEKAYSYKKPYSEVTFQNHGMLDNYAGFSIDIDTWTVVLKEPFDRIQPYRYCDLPFTKPASCGRRQFCDPRERSSYSVRGLSVKASMDVESYIDHKLLVYRELHHSLAVELESVVHIHRFVSLQYLASQPLEVTIYTDK